MKKVLSIFLAILMVLSVCVTASAASDIINLGEKKTITLNKDEEKVYNFKAPQQGIYELTAKIITDGWTEIEVIHNDNVATSSALIKVESGNETFMQLDDNCEMHFCAEKGSVFGINFINNFSILESVLEEADIGKTVKIEITITKFNAPAAKVGKNTVSKDGNVFLFVPDKSGKYNFRSNADKAIDPCVEVNDINGSLDFNNDNGYEDDYNFDLTVNLKKGNVYALVCNTFFTDWESEPTKGYNFTVSYNKKIDVEQIGLDWYENGEKIIISKGDSEYFYINIVPTGAIPFSDITVSVENEKIAEAEYDDSDNSICVQAKRIGKTTIKVTDISGLSCEYTIKVIPRFISLIMDFFDSIRMFFLLVGAGLLTFFSGEWETL